MFEHSFCRAQATYFRIVFCSILYRYTGVYYEHHKQFAKCETFYSTESMSHTKCVGILGAQKNKRADKKQRYASKTLVYRTQTDAISHHCGSLTFFRIEWFNLAGRLLAFLRVCCTYSS